MARFRGTIKGTRGEASRLGDAKNGLEVTCHGWNNGVKLVARVDDNNEDFIEVYVNNGSNDPSGKMIGIVRGGEFEVRK